MTRTRVQRGELALLGRFPSPAEQDRVGLAGPVPEEEDTVFLEDRQVMYRETFETSGSPRRDEIMSGIPSRGIRTAIVWALLFLSSSGADLRACPVTDSYLELPPCDPGSWAREGAREAADRYREQLAQRPEVTRPAATHKAILELCRKKEIRGSPCRAARWSLDRIMIPTNRWGNDCERLLGMLSENPDLWNQLVSCLADQGGTILAYNMRDRCDPVDTCDQIHELVLEHLGADLGHSWSLMNPCLRPLYPSRHDLEFLVVPAFRAE